MSPLGHARLARRCLLILFPVSFLAMSRLGLMLFIRFLLLYSMRKLLKFHWTLSCCPKVTAWVLTSAGKRSPSLPYLLVSLYWGEGFVHLLSLRGFLFLPLHLVRSSRAEGINSCSWLAWFFRHIPPLSLHYIILNRWTIPSLLLLVKNSIPRNSQVLLTLKLRHLLHKLMTSWMRRFFRLRIISRVSFIW